MTWDRARRVLTCDGTWTAPVCTRLLGGTTAEQARAYAARKGWDRPARLDRCPTHVAVAAAERARGIR